MRNCWLIFFSCVFLNNAFAVTCSDGYDALSSGLNDSTFLAPYRGTCSSGYHMFQYEYYDLYTITMGVEHCGAGYHPGPNGTCVAWPQGDCPSGQVDYSGSATFRVMPLFTDNCDSGYSKYNVSYRACGTGYGRTYMDTCAPLCTTADSLHVSDFEIPMFATKNTTPSLVVTYPDTDCYINLMPDTDSHTINISYTGGTFHAVE